MPYALPSPSSEHANAYTPSQGRAGHRRSYSHIAPPESTTFTSTSSSLGALPRRKSAGSAPPTPGAGVSLAQVHGGGHKKFQLGRDDDDEDSSMDEDNANPRPRISIKDADDDEDDDRLRRLPPLRLKLKTSSFDTAPTPFSPPQAQAQLAVPFPRSSPLVSPVNSPAIPASSLPFPGAQYAAPAPMQARSVSDQPAHPSTTNLARQIRPSVSRTSSHPILLSNGRPLKSSLKSSSSSPNIPFPSQSLVPSILWPDLHRRESSAPDHGHHHRHHQHHHERARSAPATPHLSPLTPTAPPPSLSSSQTSISPPPSLSSSITSDSNTSNTSSHSPSPSSPSLSPPPSPMSYHHAPKNVHFPAVEGNLATVKIFNKSARPASLSLSKVGEDTETETEGEGSGTGGSGGGLRWGYGGYAGGNYPGYGSAPAQRSSSRQTGYPFPRVGGASTAAGRHSPLAGASDSDERRTEKEGGWCYDLDMEHSSNVPMRGAERGEGNVYLESVGFVRAEGTSTPARPQTLTGTLLVRNVTYQKTVAVRFTMDEWHTTNDVLAKHERSLSSLPGTFWGRGNAPQDKVCSPYALESEGGQAPPTVTGVPAWDRFRFDINLEDYASSESLEKKTMWLVGRYSAGVAVAETGGELRFAPTASGGAMEEWWDNNGGGNYRVGFARVERAREGVARERKDGSTQSQGQSYRRGVIVSAPSTYLPPSQGSKSYPAPPQISASVSFPSGYAQARDMYPQQSPYAPYRNGQYDQQEHEHQLQQQREQHQQHQAALAQSTLARLRKLNLRNYAAPVAYSPLSPTSGRAISTTSTSSVDSSSTSSSVTSTDSTPLQTPVQGRDGDDDDLAVYGKAGHDVDVDVLHHHSEDERGLVGVGMGMSMENGYPATMPVSFASFGSMGSPPSSSLSKAIDISNANFKPDENGGSSHPGEPSPSNLGTTPPFSTLGGAVGKMGGGARLYWPWGSFGDVGGGGGKEKEQDRDQRQEPANDGAKADEKPQRQEEKDVHEDEDVPDVASLLSDIKERSTSTTPTPSSGSAPGKLMPPQRRRKEKEGATTPKATFSIGRGSSSNSSGSGSGSDSGSGGGSRAPPPMQGGGVSAGAGPALWGYRPGSPRPALGRNMGGGVRSPLRVSPLGSPSGSSSNLGFGPNSSLRSSPLATPTPSSGSMTSTSSESTPTATTPTPSTTGQTPSAPPAQQTDDAVYQAFVRQWCFAQGPASGAAGSGEGPRLVVG